MKNHILKSATIGFFLLSIISGTYADNLGVYGTIYPITEMDMRLWIQSKLQTMKKSGELEKWEKYSKKSIKQHVLRPPPVNGLETTTKRVVSYYDPKFILQHDIHGDKNQLIAKRGTTISPLKSTVLNEALCFINADDTRQMVWAKKQLRKYNTVKIILVSGNVKNASEELNHRVYFDQLGKLTRRLGIKYIPASVTQEKERLKIVVDPIDTSTEERGN